MPFATAAAARRKSAAAAAAMAAALLAGCASSGVETAYQLIEQQKEEQALIRQHELDEQRRQAPTQPQLMLSLIRENQARGRYFASLAYIEAYVRQFGANAQVDALRADALRMTGQAEQSEAAYRELIRGGRAAEGWHGLGLLAGARGDYAGAAGFLERAAALQPTDADMLNDLGYARLRAGDPAGARLPLGKAAELAPENPKILSNLALLLLVRGDAAGAQRLMGQAGLQPDVRNQIYRQAEDIQRQAYAAPAPVPRHAAARADQAGEDGRAVVARVPAPSVAVGDRAAAGNDPMLPIQPMMDRFGNPPLVR